MPSWGKATICSSTHGATSCFTSSMALSAVSVGSETSTWVRTNWMPLAICHFSVFHARALTSSWLNKALRSAQRSIPSNSVPDWFQFGSPAVWVVSRWICGSIKGGMASPPRAFSTSKFSLRASPIGVISPKRPLSIAICHNPSRSGRRTFSINQSGAAVISMTPVIVAEVLLNPPWVSVANFVHKKSKKEKPAFSVTYKNTDKS